MKEKEIKQVKPPEIYFRLVRGATNLFFLEEIIAEGDKIVDRKRSEETYLPIAFDKLRRATGEAFFRAVQENIDA